MTLPSRPADAPIPAKFFSGASHITDNRLRAYLNELEAQVDALVGGTTSMVVDDVLGSDDVSQDGSAANPLATIVEAQRRIALLVESEVDILVKPHGGAGYVWPRFQSRDHQELASIWVRFTEFTELIATAEAQGGSDETVIVTTGGLVADALNGKTIEILTGAAAGDRRTIIENTTTNIEPIVDFTAAVVATDTYRVLEPDPGNVIIVADQVPMVIGSGVSENVPIQEADLSPGLRVTNAIIDAPEDVNFSADARMLFFGCEILNNDTFLRCRGSGQILMGRAAWSRVRGPAAEAQASDTEWVGWGVYFSGTAFPSWGGSVGFIAGYVVAPRWIANAGQHALTGHLESGPLRCIGQADPNDLTPPTVSFGPLIPLRTPRLHPARINNPSGALAAVHAQAGSSVLLGDDTFIDSAGVCILAEDASVRLIKECSLNTGTVGLKSVRVGKISYISSATITVGTLSGNEIEVGNTPATSTIAAVTNQGDFLTDTVLDDGSIVHVL